MPGPPILNNVRSKWSVSGYRPPLVDRSRSLERITDDHLGLDGRGRSGLASPPPELGREPRVRPPTRAPGAPRPGDGPAQGAGRPPARPGRIGRRRRGPCPDRAVAAARRRDPVRPAARCRLRPGRGPVQHPRRAANRRPLAGRASGDPRGHRAGLFALAERAASSTPKHYALADECLRAVLDRQPHHPEARRLLGYVPHDGGWATPFAARNLRHQMVNHPTYGWIDATWVPHLERGELPAPTVPGRRQTRWLPADQANELHRLWEMPGRSTPSTSRFGPTSRSPRRSPSAGSSRRSTSCSLRCLPT